MSSLLRTYCRPGISKIQGVGMIAVRPISKGTVLMPARGISGTWKTVEWARDTGVDKGVIDMMQDYICGHEYDCSEYLFVPSSPIVDFNAQMLMNHSTDANLKVNSDYKLETVRDIEEGEELTEDYLCVCGVTYHDRMFKK